jgi:hypothetical protein
MHYNAANFVFFVSFHRGSMKKNIRKKERHFERSSCHFFFKESTFLERAPNKGKKKNISLAFVPRKTLAFFGMRATRTWRSYDLRT